MACRSAILVANALVQLAQRSSMSRTSKLFQAVLDQTRNGGLLPNVRVINYSAGVIDMTTPRGTLYTDNSGKPIWWKTFPNPTGCGGTWCTPNNELTWQTEVANIGTLAQPVALLASNED